MKNLCFFIFLLSTTCVLAQDSVKLSGQIKNAVSDSIKVSYNDNLIAYYPKEFFAKVDKNGFFSLTFPFPKGKYVMTELVHSRTIAELMLLAGDSLNLTVDASHFDSTIQYTGKGKEVQNFVARHTVAKGRMNQYTIKIKQAINKEPADFLKAIDLEKKSETDFLANNISGLPPSFITYWTAFYNYYNYFFMQQYPQVHEMIRHRKYTDTIPPENYDVLKKMPDAFNDSFLQVPSYLLYLTGVLDIRLKADGFIYTASEPDKYAAFRDSVYKLGYKLMPDKSAEYFIAQNIYGRARTQEIAITKLQFDQFNKRWPHSVFTPALTKQIAIAVRLAPGHPAPDFVLHTSDSKALHLSDLRGKVVYLTFWAGWCRQCVGEMSSIKKTKELIRNKPLEFVFVSINNDTLSDQTMIKRLKIDGIFTNVSDGWNSKVIADYGVQSLPAYYLIDEEGNFALQNTPPPPQSTQLILEIEKLFR